MPARRTAWKAGLRLSGHALSASYLQYGHAPGKARARQAVAISNGKVENCTANPGNLAVGLYSAQSFAPK